MKRFFTKLTTFITAVSLCVIYSPISSFAMSVKEHTKDKKNLYTMTATDDEWLNIKNSQEKDRLTQLPEEFIHAASTEELYDAVLEYPLLINLAFYDDRTMGLEQVAKQFNGLAALLKRNDLTSVVIDKYSKITIPTSQKMSTADDKEFYKDMDAFIKDKENREKIEYDVKQMMTPYLAESLLLYEPVYQKISDKEKHKVVGEVFEKAVERGKSPLYGCQTSSGFLNEVAVNSDLEEWEDVVDDYFDLDDQSTTKSSSSEKMALQANQAALASTTDAYSTIYIKTPRNSKVKCKLYKSNPKNSTAYADNYIKGIKLYKPYQTIAKVDNGYINNNCHAYAWAGRQDIWMNDPSKYVTDKSYKALTGKPTKNGQKVMWGSLHSGIVVDYTKQSPLIVSKWGPGPVVKCSADLIPQAYPNATSATYFGRFK